MPPDASSSSTSPPLFTRYGFTRTGDSEAPLTIDPYPAICVDGTLRATVVASAVDLVGGLFTREIAGTDATFTSDLSLRIPRPGAPARLRAHGERLRAGRRLITTRVVLSTESDDAREHTLYALGETTFTRVPRDTEDAPELERLSTPETIPRHPFERALDEAVGVRLVAPEAGRVELPLHEDLLNPEGVMQGALVALVVECAALAIARRRFDAGFAVTELDLRYLAAASKGPVRSEAAWIGAPEARMLGVELRDAGRADRLTTTALVRLAEIPSRPQP